MWNKVKDAAGDLGNSLKDKTDSAIDTIKAHTDNAGAAVSQFSIGNSVRDFAVKSASIVEEIDEQLTTRGASFEVASFRVAATASVIGGMTLDIMFSKTSVAKVATNERRQQLEVFNPATKQVIRILRSAFKGKEIAKVRDPVSGEVLQINVSTGEIIPSDTALEPKP